jgi:HSP20 family protein
MSEQDKNQPRNLLIGLLIAALIIFSAVQTWYLIIMKDQLDNLQNSQVSSRNIPAQIASTQDTTVHNKSIQDKSIQNNETAVQETNPVADLPSQDVQSATQPDDLKNKAQTEVQQDPVYQADSRRSKPSYRRPPPPRSLFDNDFFNDPYDSRQWDPFAEIERMQREMDRMLDDTYRQLYNRPGQSNNSHNFYRHFSSDDFMPEIDLKENREEYIVRLKLPPNADENDISVTLEGQRLIIKSRREQRSQQRDSSGNFVFRERSSGNFQRSISLREPVYEGGMKSKMDNGVLTIIIPKAI